ncbi:MAG: molybdenum cofactor guanylyltransferase [Mariprofundales bacterium]|nr:molybdenum cofactor guanylyltransferase [Mariprofundales bacterium]
MVAEELPTAHCSAVVLAGGDSTRMGSDKARALLAGKPMLSHVLEQLTPLFEQVVVSVRRLRSDVVCQQLVDNSADRAPMVGIRRAVAEVSTQWLFVTGCDMPLISVPLLQEMASRRGSCDAVVASVGGCAQPLFAFYAKSALPVLSAHMKQGQRSMVRLLEVLDCHRVAEEEVRVLDPELISFTSIDTVEELKVAEARYYG